MSLSKKPILVGLLFLLQACGEEKTQEIDVDALVSVNGVVISQVDLAVTKARLMPESTLASLGNAADKKALESLVMMSVIAQKSEALAQPDALALINAKTRQYREELLTEAYMREHANVQAPSEQEVADFYQSNKALFGERPVKQFSIVRAVNTPKDQQLATVLDQLRVIKQQEDWAEMSTSLAKNPLLEKIDNTSDAGPQLKHDILRVVEKLDQGDTSSIVFVDGKPHLIRVTKASIKKAAPLAQVRSNIRKALAAKKLKQQLKAVAGELTADADIKYFE